MNRILKRPSATAGSVKLATRGSQPAQAGRPSPPGAAPAELPRVETAAAAAHPRAGQPVAPALPAAELQALREQAHREGLEQGRLLARKELEQALREHAKQAHAVMDKLEAAVSIKLHALDEAAVSIGFEAAARVIGRAYADAQGVAQIVQQMLGEFSASLELTVYVAPALADAVRSALEHQPGWEQRRLRVEADSSLAATECRVDSGRGMLETSLAMQLQGIQDSLLRAHHGSGQDKR